MPAKPGPPNLFGSGNHRTPPNSNTGDWHIGTWRTRATGRTPAKPGPPNLFGSGNHRAPPTPNTGDRDVAHAGDWPYAGKAGTAEFIRLREPSNTAQLEHDRKLQSMELRRLAEYDFRSNDLALLAGALTNGTQEWRAELGEVDDDSLVWQPFPNAHSIGALILHIADVEAAWIECVAAGKQRPEGEEERLLSESTRQYDVHWPVPPRQPLDWYMAQHDQVRARTLQTLSELQDGSQIVKSPWAERTYTIDWIVSHVIAHESYHGGQAVLLKLMRSHSA